MLANELMIWKSKRTNLYAFKVSHLFSNLLCFWNKLKKKMQKRKSNNNNDLTLADPLLPLLWHRPISNWIWYQVNESKPTKKNVNARVCLVLSPIFDDNATNAHATFYDITNGNCIPSHFVIAHRLSFDLFDFLFGKCITIWRHAKEMLSFNSDLIVISSSSFYSRSSHWIIEHCQMRQ